MVKVIEKWLRERLGISLKLESPNLGSRLYNGEVYYELLKSYNIINEHFQKQTVATYEAAYSYLLQLSFWFKLLGVSHTKEFLQEIAMRNKNRCLQLLIELYIKLEDKDNIYMMNKQRELGLLTKGNDRFTLQPCKEPKIESPNESLEFFLESSLAESKDVIPRYKLYKKRLIEESIEESQNKRAQWVETNNIGKRDCNDLKKGYKDWIRDTSEEDVINTFECKLPIRNKPYSLFEKVQPKDHIEYLKGKRKRTNEFENYKTEMRYNLIHDYWKSIVNKQEEELENSYKQKIKQQSIFEQKLTFRLLRTFECGQSLLQHKILIEHIPREFIFKPRMKPELNVEKEKLEKLRILDLHGRLQTKIEKIKYEVLDAICRQIIVDLTDISILMSEFRQEANMDVPNRMMYDWKELFCKSIPFFISDQLEDLEEGSEYGEDGNTSYEQLLNEKRQRDKIANDILNDFHIKSYLSLTGPWSEAYFPDLTIKMENLIITSHNIHRLLEYKYPLADPLKGKDSLMNFSTRAILISLLTPDFVASLKKFLSKPNVAVVEISDAINYCLDVFKREKPLVDLSKSLYKKIDGKQFKMKAMSIPDLEELANLESVLSKQKGKKNHLKHLYTEDKSTQYPSVEDFHSATYSTAGMLGKIIFELLHNGEILTDMILCKMMVAYLETLMDYSGFVLINFPNSVQQALLMELLITGNMFQAPIAMDGFIDVFNLNTSKTDAMAYNMVNLESLYDRFGDRIVKSETPGKPNKFMKETTEFMEIDEEELSGEEESETEEDEDSSDDKTKDKHTKKTGKKHGSSKHRRLSVERSNKKVNSPSSYSEEPDETMHKKIYELPVSQEALVELRKSKILPPFSKEDDRTVLNMSDNSYFTTYIIPIDEKKLRDDLLEEAIRCVNEIQNSFDNESRRSVVSTAEKLYKKFKIFRYVELGTDHEAVKRYARAILDQLDSPECPLRAASIDLFGENISEPSTERPMILAESSNAYKKYSLAFRETFFKANEEMDRLNECPERQASYQKYPTLVEEPQDDDGDPFPGSPNWKYMNEPISNEFQLTLASVWEVVEKVYLENLGQVMQALRLHVEKIIPYANFGRNLIQNLVNQNDERTVLVTNFQLMLNEIDDDFRKSTDLKNELHVRVNELNGLLTNLIKKKKMECLSKKRELAENQWMYHYSSILINIFISMMQTELDRFIDTAQILNDYYFAMLGNPPEENRLDKLTLKRYDQPSIPAVSSTSLLKKPKKAKKNVPLEEIPTPGRSFFQNFIHQTFSLNPTTQAAIAKAKKTLAYIKSMIRDEKIGRELRFRYYRDAGRKAKIRADKSSSLGQLKEVSDTQQALLALSSSFTSDKRDSKVGNDEAKERKAYKLMDIVDKLKWEWETAIQNEFDRFVFRSKVIEERAVSELDFVISVLKNVLDKCDSLIKFQEMNELMAVQDLCSVLIAAIEDESPIQPLLCLVNDIFYIDNTNLLFPDPSPLPPPPLISSLPEWDFTMEQLDNFVTKMSYLSHAGVIEGVFLSVLEDMAISTKLKHVSYLPKGWCEMKREDLKLLLRQAYGDLDILDWRSFVLLVANIPYPTINQLLDIKKYYEIVDKEKMGTLTFYQFMNIPLWFDKEFGTTLQDDLKLALAKDLLLKLFQVNNNEINYLILLLAFCKDDDQMEGFLRGLLVLGKDKMRENFDCLPAEVEKDDTERMLQKYVIQCMREALHTVDSLDVKTLPKGATEYIITEKILIGPPPLVFSTSIEEETTFLHISEEEPTRQDARFLDATWNLCVPYELVISLITAALDFYPLSPNHVHKYLQFEENLSELFRQKGKNGFIKAYLLADSVFLQEFLASTGLFKHCDISGLAEKEFSHKT